jgi:hypothetical protein
VWFDFLTKGLIQKLGFQQSENDPCVLWKGTCMIVIYTDDTIITGPYENEIKQVIQEINSIYEITHRQQVDDFLGVNTRRKKQKFHLTQPVVIEQILRDLGLKEDSRERVTPMISTTLHSYD